jgi:metallophosphoesterase (TIGR00282 family)
MKILYIGDITAKLGRQTVAAILPDYKKTQKIDLVIAQGENVTHGKGLRRDHLEELLAAGVDFFTGGNHSIYQPETLSDTTLPLIRPANLPDAPGRGFAMVDTAKGKLLIISLQGQIVGMDARKTVDNPLTTIDRILDEHKSVKRAGTVVNFHGDFSSEKVVIGQYLDGSVSAVIGDHWHVPTADAQVLPKGTAHLTDVGMTGALDSSLGVKTEIITYRWLTGQPSRNEMEETGRRQFCAALVELDTNTQLAKSIKLVRQII